MGTPRVDIWMPIYIGDYLRDTQNLTAEENGVYFLLLMYYWQKKGVIGSDVHRLSIVGKSDERTTAYILETFFQLRDGNYKNKRADVELANARSRSDAARANVNKRWQKNRNTDDDTGVLPPYNDSNTVDDTDGIPEGYSSSSSSSSSSKPSTRNRSVSTRFRKPDLDEVRTYCNIRKNHVDPQRFLDFYESKGWKVGKTPMKDWKAAVRTWETNGHANGAPVLKVHERSTFLDMEEG